MESGVGEGGKRAGGGLSARREESTTTNKLSSKYIHFLGTVHWSFHSISFYDVLINFSGRYIRIRISTYERDKKKNTPRSCHLSNWVTFGLSVSHAIPVFTSNMVNL